MKEINKQETAMALSHFLAPPRSIIQENLQKMDVPRVKCFWSVNSELHAEKGEEPTAWGFSYSVIKYFYDMQIAADLETWRLHLAEVLAPFEIQQIDFIALRDVDDGNSDPQCNAEPAFQKFIENVNKEFGDGPQETFRLQWGFFGPRGGFEAEFFSQLSEYDGTEERLQNSAEPISAGLADWFHGLTRFSVDILR